MRTFHDYLESIGVSPRGILETDDPETMAVKKLISQDIDTTQKNPASANSNASEILKKAILDTAKKNPGAVNKIVNPNKKPGTF